MEYNSDNIFAKIIRKEVTIPAHVIFETDVSIAILDAFPATAGHSLLIPKCEAVTLADLATQDHLFCGNLMQDLARLNKIVSSFRKTTAVNTVVNSLPDSGQLVPHLHFHVLPRSAGDNLLRHPKSAASMISPEEAKSVLGDMKST
ncbi:histidine triad (HIT) protein [Gregarina niphandrodes]|uniref:Histidine triad (HIT) protein n=1 Tax=Gregarina niphandrodes TaxID=110365 RepID=A0A023B7G5_GRENI|nr:histidine triad (HIT) protein [Gregarina niphandrodes]EZG67263.1 histidine triad (HIT) protein [Gregarina niphandrodes]|eukprot:XP_011130278.1 histidine triad (HIT) protein [Gregarina niphandrodes]